MSQLTTKGTMSGMRVNVFERPRRQNPAKVSAVCRIKDDDGFIYGKVYRVSILPSGRVAVKDENGETTICDPQEFDFENRK